MNCEYVTEIYMLELDNEEQTTFDVAIDLRQTAPYVPAQLYGPPENCYPAEGPEFEPESFFIILQGRRIKLTAKQMEQLIGRMRFDKVCEEAEKEAMREGGPTI